MNSSKRDVGHKLEQPPVSLEALKNQRMAQEQAKKDAGIWGEMSVGTVEKNDAAFVHVWKGVSENSVHRLAAKRPKETSKAEHEALCLWLKAGGYDGFKHKISAWNVNADEAAAVKKRVIAELAEAGVRVVNPAA
jgi:hypothetical protein